MEIYALYTKIAVCCSLLIIILNGAIPSFLLISDIYIYTNTSESKWVEFYQWKTDGAVGY